MKTTPDPIGLSAMPPIACIAAASPTATKPSTGLDDVEVAQKGGAIRAEPDGERSQRAKLGFWRAANRRDSQA